MGSSLFASIPASSALNAQGRCTSAIDASELLYYDRGFGRDTLAVLVSRSGESVEVVKLLPILRSRGVRIIGITNEPASTLAKEADIAIRIASDADRLIALRTYTATVATLLFLSAEAAGLPATGSSRLPDLMKRTIDEELGQTGDPWPADTRVYLLGRGPSLGSVHEGALLFHETARASAVGMSCAQFRHGPVEATNASLRAFVFASQPETRKLDEMLASDLRNAGAQARSISIPEVSGPWAAVLEIIPVQIAAARLAEQRGVPPASFQFAPMVTVDEAGFENPASGDTNL